VGANVVCEEPLWFGKVQWRIEVLRETRCVIGWLEGRVATGGFEELQ